MNHKNKRERIRYTPFFVIFSHSLDIHAQKYILIIVTRQTFLKPDPFEL